ncbi:MAG: hypothetical protein ABSF71_03495 [Terriglobia bacterium]
MDSERAHQTQEIAGQESGQVILGQVRGLAGGSPGIARGKTRTATTQFKPGGADIM